jgi:tRNA/rRNA methyltransferase
MTLPSPRTRFILIETSHAGNVGGVARAMKVMGFDDLVLVRPRWDNVLRREETIQRASGALDVLRNARIVDTLDEALEGMTHLCATAMVARDFGPPTRTPRQHLGPLAMARPPGVAFLFGSERFGMSNDDVYRCHVALRIPTDPSFGSLNLASAVQVIAYEWREALGGWGDPDHEGTTTSMQAAGNLTGGDSNSARPAELGASADFSPVAPALADARQIAGLLQHWEQSLVEIGFLDPQAPKKLMPRLQQLFNRAALTPEEVHILRGVARQMTRHRAEKG